MSEAPAGQLQAEIWRVLRADGSTSNEVIQDVNSQLAVPFERHVILDALDGMVDANVVTLRESGRYHRGSRVKVRDDGGITWVEGGYVSATEERLDNAWPRRGGRREIVRALSEDVHDHETELVELLREALVEIRKSHDGSPGSWLDDDLAGRIEAVIRERDAGA